MITVRLRVTAASAVVSLALLGTATHASAEQRQRTLEEENTGEPTAPDRSLGEPPAPDPDDTPRLRGADLKREVPDIKIRQWPPPLGISFVFGGRWPLQVFGAGVAVEGYPTNWLRLSALYMAGASASRRTLLFSSYAEAFVGIRAVGFESERAVDVMPASGYVPFGRPQPQPILKAGLPSYNAFIVEGGMLSGLISLERCVPDCTQAAEDDTLPLETRQLVFPAGGLRYVYFVSATSKRMKALDRQQLIQAYAHLIVRPLNDSGNRLLWRDGEPVQRTTFGGRVGVEVPSCLSGCVSLSLELGYLPMPGSFLFQIGLT